MRKKLNKFYWSYIIVSVVVIIVLAIFESTGFQMQENFKKDLRISLPDYTVEKIEIDFSEEDARRFRLI
jgi:preprotein translocase subunit SecF